jgi:type IV secretion system protein VirB1
MLALPLAVILSLAAPPALEAAPDTVAAIACKESGSSHCVNVYPFSIHDNCSGRSHFPATQREAIATAVRLLLQCDSIDAGPMQVNSRNWSWVGLTVSTVFDPEASVPAGIKVMHAAYDQCGGRNGLTPVEQVAALSCMFSRYNTGSSTAGQGYAQRVWQLASYIPSIKELASTRTTDAAQGGSSRPQDTTANGDASPPAGQPEATGLRQFQLDRGNDE